MVAAVKPSWFFERGTELAIVNVPIGETCHGSLFGQQSEPGGFEPPFIRVEILYNFQGLQDQLISCYKVPFANCFGLGKLCTGWGSHDDRKTPRGLLLISPLHYVTTDCVAILGVRVQGSHLIALRHQHGGGTARPCEEVQGFWMWRLVVNDHGSHRLWVCRAIQTESFHPYSLPPSFA